MAADSTTIAGPPAAAPATFNATRVTNPATGLVDPFTLQLSWSNVANADGYLLWVSYGINDATADWDKLAIVPLGTTSFRHEALNVAKTYRYQVQAFNGKGFGPMASASNTTPIDLPLDPMNLSLVSIKGKSVTISWFDQADNEVGFVIERQDVPATGPFVEIARIPTPNGAASGGVNYTDSTAQRNKTYNYQVAAYNASGMSGYTVPPLQVFVK